MGLGSIAIRVSVSSIVCERSSSVGDGWSTVRDSDGSLNVLNNWSVCSVGVVLSSRISKVSSNSVRLDDGGIKRGGTANVSCCWGCEESSVGNGNDGQESNDALHVELELVEYFTR